MMCLELTLTMRMYWKLLLGKWREADRWKKVWICFHTFTNHQLFPPSPYHAYAGSTKIYLVKPKLLFPIKIRLLVITIKPYQHRHLPEEANPVDMSHPHPTQDINAPQLHQVLQIYQGRIVVIPRVLVTARGIRLLHRHHQTIIIVPTQSHPMLGVHQCLRHGGARMEKTRR